jgi:hypothetical protein
MMGDSYMPEYPYANVIGNLSKFIEGIPSRGIPDKIDAEHLKQIGFTSTNDLAMVSVLSFIGFIDESGKPNDNYSNFRISSKQEETMSECLKSAYSELFKLYPDAQNVSTKELADFFKSKTKSGELVISRMVSTFLLLCEFSTMKPEKKKAIPKKTPQRKTTKKAPVPAATVPIVEKKTYETKKQPQVVVNIQLVLPESKDPTLYDELFKSLKKHLLE